MERFSYEGSVNVLVDAPVGSGWDGRLRIGVEKLDDDVTE